MNKTIPFNQLPREVERFLRTAIEEHESVVFEDEGGPVAAVLSIEAYYQLLPNTPKKEGQMHQDKDEATDPDAAEMSTDLSYELPADLLGAYHQLLDKKFTTGLSAEEQAELRRVDQELDAAELSQPLVQSIRTKAAERDKRWTQTLDEVLTKLRELRELT